MFKWRIVLTIMMLTYMTPGVAVSSLSSSMPVKSENIDSSLSGNWTVRWLSNDSRNPMTLNQNTINFTGQYVNDSKDNCDVSGDLDPTSHLIKLQVKCPKWDIQMEGFPTLDGKIIVGEYLAYGRAVGGFIMSKK
jgi:hypothetical protein